MHKRQEYALAAEAFSLDEAALMDLAERAVSYAFVSEAERAALRARAAAFRREWQQAGAARGGGV